MSLRSLLLPHRYVVWPDGLVAQGRRVVSFPIHEYWLDIGRIDDYERVQLDVSAGKVGPR